MLSHIISSSAVILAVILIRALFRGKIPNRMIYALWAIVFIRLVIPGNLFEITLPAETEVITNAGVEFYSAETDNQASSTDSAFSQNQIQSSAQVEIPPETQPGKTVAAELHQNTDWKTVAKYVYIAGATGVLGWFAFSEITVWRRLKSSRRFLKKDGRINVYISDASVSPCVFGFIPSIYVTSESVPSDKFELILMHERAHIKHFDSLRSILRRLIVAVFWFNPFVWAYMLLAARDAELACDETVTNKLNEKECLSYAKMILDHAPRTKGSAAGFGGKPMKKRIIAITNKTIFKKLPIILALMIALSICTAGFTGCTESTDNENPSASADETSDSAISDGVPLLPSLETRANSEYVRSCKGGMDYTYEELVSMTPEEIGRMMLGPKTRYGYFYDYPVLAGSTKSDFVDSEGNTYTAVKVEADFLSPDYESLVAEIRKYFSKDIAVELFSKGIYFEYGEEFLMLDSIKFADTNSTGTKYEIVSSSETEIVYKGTTKYLLSDEDYEIYVNNPETVFPEESYETKHTKYVLSLEDGEWVFTYFEY